MNPLSLSTREVVWVVAATVLGLAPHMQRFPILLSMAFLVAAAWRILGAMHRLPLPDRQHMVLWVTKQVVALAAFAAVYVAYRGQLGREAGVELLAALLGLKLLEMRSARDYYVVAFLGYFLVVTNFFYSQTMYTAVYMLGLVLLITAVLIQFNTPHAYRNSARMARLSAVMVAQALPLMLICFVLFPRIPGPLWGLPQDAFSGVTGLSNEMQLGQIARLGLSDEIAFRVEFNGREPSARDLYWRGPVFWNTDGRNWAGGDVGNGPATAVEAIGEPYSYRVTLEAHRMRLLLGLDLVTEVGTNARITNDRRLLAPSYVRRRTTYELTSTVDYRAREISARERQHALQLPPGWHPRARALAERWRDEETTESAIIDRSLNFYAENEFYYSLTPPQLPDDPVDQFLFESREGFCEHFAASFVVLMRAAGIPARVVTGYQGGEYNTVADYMVIRQRDAHAWAEVYKADQGWVRVDPTAAVAPERVSLGLDALPRRSLARGADPSDAALAFWGRIRDSFDAITYNWNQWVLGYSPSQQQRLLDDLGLGEWDYGDLIIALTISLALAVALLAAWLIRLERGVGDMAQTAWLEFCAKLGRLGYERGPAEAPRAFASRVILQRADLAAEISQITRLYTQIRYGRVPLDPRQLRDRVRRFRPRRRS